ncbi:MAG: hypothetical protein M3O82_09465, partial [Verrucomicrobiota bacterium]|nr:hypothetical protein [Verrucomicrobiota bacterium]
MAKLDTSSQRDNKSRNSNDPNFNWRGLILFAAAIILIGGAFVVRGGGFGVVDEISYSDFNTLLESGQIRSPIDLVVEEGRQTQFLRGHYTKGPQSSELAQFRT